MQNSTIFNNRDFLLLWSGNAASSIGLNGVRLAYPLLALILTDSPFAASWVAFAITVPSLIFEVPAGIASDYWDRRRTLVMCQQLGLVATLVAAVVVITRPPGLPLFLTLAAFVEGTAYVFFSTSELGLVRDVVAVDERPAAFAFLEAEQPIANMVGRTLGAATLGIARSLPFLANATSYLYCLWTLSRMRSTAGESPNTMGRKAVRVWDWNHAWAGVRTIWAEPFVRRSTIIMALTNVIFQIFILLITVEVRDSGHSAWEVGVVLGATGLGGLLGVVPAAGLARRFSPRVLVTVMVWAWALLCVPLVASAHPVVLGLCWLGVGFAAPIGNVSLTLHRVHAFPEELIGRVYGAIKLIANGGAVLGSLCAGTLLSMLGVSTTGWALVAGMVLLARTARRLPEPGIPAAEIEPSVAPHRTNWIAQLSRNDPTSPESW
ncbi:MFS transporter [Nocardia tengchongensis]|uniref:MFS transporter n=1 Tax=Nocardia tengchongensis TaxID=2055889 RepID=UPI00360908E4